ncbi:MAG: hypothetical protein ABI693_20605 [Bryobacteraceae bacterium]
MHEPNSERKIETIIDGERVCGEVHYGGSSDMSVRLEQPSDERLTGFHMPNFARSTYPEGFLGEYGEQRALEILADLYHEQKKGDRRRKFADLDFEEFGRVRYLKSNPGHCDHGRTIRGQASIDSTIHVQIEDDGPYGLARFFDSVTNEPFLAESAVYEQSVPKYVNGVKADVGFLRRLNTIRKKLLPDMQGRADHLKSHRLSPHQLSFLANFGQCWRSGEIPLDAAEVDQLIDLGYLIRDLTLCEKERASIEVSLTRSREAIEEFEAAGQHELAAQCQAKVQKLQQRREIKTLMITALGKLAVNNRR